VGNSEPSINFVDAFAARRSSLDAAALFTWLCQICRNQLADARRAFRAEWQLLMRVPTFNSAR
jgi:DNA-directed RNA polymerase specialized sigma24 family protein